MNNISDAKVMIIDDTPANLKVLYQILKNEGYKISVFPSGILALKAIKRIAPDIILLDIQMPEMTGYELCDILKSDPKYNWIPIIFISALQDTQDKVKAFSTGGADYITKPFQLEEVKARVQTHLSLGMAMRKLKAQNKLLEENLRLRNDVERITRHDLKTPLSAIIGIPDLMQKDPNLTPEQVDMINIVKKSGQRIQHMINESIDFFKMEKGTYKLDPVPIEILSIIRQICNELSNSTASSQLCNIHINGKPATPDQTFIVPGEQMLFYSLFSNLIKNAKEASPPDSKISININTENEISIEINNQGVISEAIRDNFFDCYATHGKKHGSGIGTYCAKIITEILGGKISFTSNKKYGTTLFVQLPPCNLAAVIKPAEEKPDDGKSGGNFAGIKTLIVDDFPHMRQLIKRFIKNLGLTSILEAEDGEAALTKLQSNEVNLIISDWNMPRKSGIELFTEIKSMAGNQPEFLLISGETHEATQRVAEESGISHFILKPFSPDRLREKVTGMLQQLQANLTSEKEAEA